MKIPTSGDVQHEYWQGSISRAEAQNSFDEFASTLMKMQEQLIKHEFLTGFLMAKFNVQPEEVQVWMSAKAEEFKAQQAAQGAQPPAETPSVTLN